jgi:hypothetical protein
MIEAVLQQPDINEEFTRREAVGVERQVIIFSMLSVHFAQCFTILPHRYIPHTNTP